MNRVKGLEVACRPRNDDGALERGENQHRQRTGTFAGNAVGARRPSEVLIAVTSVFVPTALPATLGRTAQFEPFVMSLMTTESERPPDGSRGLPRNLSCATLVWR